MGFIYRVLWIVKALIVSHFVKDHQYLKPLHTQKKKSSIYSMSLVVKGEKHDIVYMYCLILLCLNEKCQQLHKTLLCFTH